MQNIYLLHGWGGSREGSVKNLTRALRPHLRVPYTISRPNLPHQDRSRPAEESVAFLNNLGVVPGSLLVGISLGGLVAAKLQEEGRSDLHTIAISSPTSFGSLFLTCKMRNRLALYSSQDAVIAGRTENWPSVANSYDLSWLTHDTDQHVQELAQVVAAYVNGDDFDSVLTRS